MPVIIPDSLTAVNRKPEIQRGMEDNSMQFDYIIQGGTVIDGTGSRAPFQADVGIAGARIAAIGNLDSTQANRVIDAHRQVVSPGFIDVHVHSEIALLGGRDQMASVRQGVTTHLTAPDGFGWAPLPLEQAKQMWDYTRFAYGDANLSLDWPTVEAYLSIFPGRIPVNLYRGGARREVVRGICLRPGH